MKRQNIYSLPSQSCLTVACNFSDQTNSINFKSDKSREEEIATGRLVFDGLLPKSKAINWKQYITSLPKPVPSILVF